MSFLKAFRNPATWYTLSMAFSTLSVAFDTSGLTPDTVARLRAGALAGSAYCVWAAGLMTQKPPRQPAKQEES